MKSMTTRHFGIVLSVFAAATLVSPIASADDADDVQAVIDTYLATETVDLAKQAKWRAPSSAESWIRMPR